MNTPFSVPEEWLDVDLAKLNDHIAPAGMLDDPDDPRPFGSAFPQSLIVPESQWRERVEFNIDNDPRTDPNHPPGCLVAQAVPPEFVYDQSPTSMCVANAACGAAMRRWNVSNDPKNWVKLSCCHLYARICTWEHSGAYCWDAMEQMTEYGTLPASTYDQDSRFPMTMQENKPWVSESNLPAGWQQHAKLFRVKEWYSINSKLEFVSALLNQCPIVYGRSGHSIVAEDLIFDGNQPIVRSCCSYAYNNRDGTGRIYESERNWSTGGAWACASVTLAGDDFPEPTNQPWLSRYS